MKYIVLILLSFINAFATNYVNEFPTYVYGDIRPIAAIYNSIAMITSSEIYQNLIYLAILFSTISLGWMVTVGKDLVGALKGGSFAIGSIAVLLVPVDVHLVDKRLDFGLINNYYQDHTLGYEKISNVPWLIALTPSIATTISTDLIELANQAFKGNTLNYSGMKDIGKTGYSELGYNKAYDMINTIVDKYSFEEIGTQDASNFKKDFKIYLVDCVIPKTVNNTLVTTKLINPSKDIYSSLSPTEIGLTVSDEVVKRDGSVSDCVSFYTEIIANLKGLNTDTFSTLSRLAGTPDIKAIKGMNNIMLADIQSTVFSNTTEQLAIYAQNLAAAPLIKTTIEDYYRGTGMSGQEIANSITASKSNANIQTQGLGQFKWMAQILPFAMHFLFGIILASSIFTLLMIVARGTYHGSAIARHYFGGFIQFEAIRVSTALVNNLVMYYATIGAVDKLTEFGGNPLATTRVPSYLEYIAQWEGVSGLLAVSAIFLIPAIAMKGDVASIASSMQGISGRYVGNDVETSRDATSKSSARQRAVGNVLNDEQAMKKLEQMGLSVPKERMPLEYYNAVTNDLSSMSSGIGNMLSQDKMDNFAKGTTANTASKISNTAGYGSSVNLSSAENVAFQDGQVQGIQTNATEDYRNKANWDANKVGTGKAIQAVGKDVSAMATSDLASSDSGFESYAKGSYNQGAMATVKTQAVGGLNLSTEDLNKIGDTVKASIQSEIGKGQGVQENIKKYGEDAYKTSSEYGERSNLAKTMEKISAQGGVDNAVNLDATDSMIKAVQQVGTIGGTMATYENAAKSTGRSIGQVIEDLSKDLTQGKIGSDMATVDYANANGGYVHFQEKSARDKTSSAIATLDGKTGSMINESGALTEQGYKTTKEMSEGKAKSDIRTVQEYDKNYTGGYTQAQVDSASVKAGQDMSNLQAQKDGKFINDEGLTNKGIDAYGITPTEQAAILDAKHSTFYGKNADTTANNIVNALKGISKRDASLEAMNIAKENKLNEEDTKKFVDDYVNNKLQEVENKFKELGMIDKNGKVQSGDAMVGALSKMGAMNYASSKSLTFDGKNITMGIDSSNGEAKVFNSNSSSNVNGGQNNAFSKLDSSTTGNKSEENDNYDVKNKGEQLNYDPLIDLVGNDTVGEIAKEVLQGAVVLGALDAITGGKVKNRIKDAKDKYLNQRKENKGLVNGKDGDGGKKWYNPENRTDVEEYLDKNKGAKSYLELDRDLSEGRPTSQPSGPNFPQSAETANATTNNTKADNNADAINNSSNKYNSNYNTSENEMSQNSGEKSLNQQKIDLANKNPESLARETFVNQANMKAKENLDAFRNGSIDKQSFSDKNAKLATFMSKVENGADISPKELDSLGIKSTSELPLETKMSKNNKPYQVVNTSEYGQQIKEVEAQKFRDVETKVSNSDIQNDFKNENIEGSGNSQSSMSPKEVGENELKNKINERRNVIDEAFKNGEMKPSEYETQKTKLSNIEDRLNSGKDVHTNKLEQAGISTKGISSKNGVVDLSSFAEQLTKPNIEIQHPKIENFITEAEAKTAGIETKGFFRQRFDAVQDALNSGVGFKTKLGLTASALILGSQSETFANALNAVDPMQMVIGQDLGKDSDIVSAQNMVSPKMVQSQLSALPESMKFIGNEQPQQVAQNQVLQQVYEQYKNNMNGLANGSLTQEQFDNNNMHLNNVAQNTMMNKPISQTSMEYAGLNTQNMPFDNGILNMQSYGQNFNSSNFTEVLRDGQVRNELSNIYSEQYEQSRMLNSNEEQMQKLQMMEMRNSIGKVSEKMKSLEDINFTSEDLEMLRNDLKKMRIRSN